MSIMDMFRMSKPAPEPQAPTTNGQQQQSADPSLKQDPQGPDINAQVKQPEGLDKFNDLWKAPQKKEGDAPEFNPSAIFDLDPAKMAAAIGQINFAEVVSKDDLAAIVSGGEGAMDVFMKALNGTAAKTMTMATTASAKMIEQALSQASGAMDSKISQQVKLNQVNSQMQEVNPALSSPAAAPIVNALKVQFTNQFPTSSPKEITDMVNEYLVNFADLAAGKKPDPEVNAGKPTTDWSKYLGMGQQS